MLMPEDYSDEAIADPDTARLMQKIALEHGGPEIRARLGVAFEAVEVVACEFLHRRYLRIRAEFNSNRV